VDVVVTESRERKDTDDASVREGRSTRIAEFEIGVHGPVGWCASGTKRDEVLSICNESLNGESSLGAPRTELARPLIEVCRVRSTGRSLADAKPLIDASGLALTAGANDDEVRSCSYL